MIRHVSIRNWKAFDQLELDLPEGTSFIVARNGVGKTSLLQALHFGLFGDRRLLASGTRVERAVRGGPGHKAQVALTVGLGSSSWVIAREVPGDLAPRGELPPSSVTVNGTNVSEEAWQQALTDAAGVGLTELRLLAAIGEGETLSTTDIRTSNQYNVIHHLAEVLGVSRLRESAVALRRLAKEAAGAADNERLTLRVRPQRSSSGERERLAREGTQLRGRAADLTDRLADVESRQRQRRDWADWRSGDRALREAASSAVDRMRRVIAEKHRDIADFVQRAVLLPSEPDRDAPASEMVEYARAVQRQVLKLVDELRARRDSELRMVGGVEARIASIDDALQLLSGASATCPTCRQPLPEGIAEQARSEHLRERTQLLEHHTATHKAAARLESAIAELTTAAELPLWSATAPPAEPVPGGSIDEDAAAAAHLSNELRFARARLQEIEAAVRVHQAEEEQRATDTTLSRRLVPQYRRADMATVTAASFDALADSLCRERINPLAELLAKRWSELWPGRPALSLDLNTGEVIGRVADAQIALADLSGGERAVAIVLLRLLALQSASNSPILLMDEPLEHLDPRNRRLLASLLVAATRGGEGTAPRQVLVTTYEESVTRRLDQQVAGGGSHVVYVTARRQDG